MIPKPPTGVFGSRHACRLAALSIIVLCVGLALSSTAAASDATLRLTLNNWSRRIQADAHSVALAAQRRHPRRMTYSALRFRSDALRAKTAITAERPSTAKGQRARQLALTAFADYATAGSRWAASGRARLKGDKLAARGLAHTGAASARAANRLLISAGRMLR